MFGKLVAVVGCCAAAVVAQINIPGTVPVNPVEPLQHHLAYAGTTGMTVSWSTYTKIDTPTVYYGESVWDLSAYATGESVTYDTSAIYSNHVKITGLKPDTEYYYYVSDSNCYNCSELIPYTFKTARPTGDYTPYTVGVVIDMGVMGQKGLNVNSSLGGMTVNDHNTMQSLARYKDELDLILHPGDLAYADSWLPEVFGGVWGDINITMEEGLEIYNYLYNAFYDQLQPITAYKPYMVGPGNHESNCDEGGSTDAATGIHYNISLCFEGQRNFSSYKNHFRMPSAESGGVGNFWYSFDHGMVHYVFLNSETDLGNGLIGEDDVDGPENMYSGPFGSYENEQVDWLEADLAAVDRVKTPWIVVTAHRPWYVSASNVSNTLCWNCKKAFEPTLLKYNVDIVFYGHVHFYERSNPVANGIPDPNGLNNPSAPMYILNGAGGHYDGLTTYTLPINNYSAYLQNSTYGWSRLTFHNCTHLTHEFVASGNDTVLDTATLYKAHGCVSNSSSNYTRTNNTIPTDRNGAVQTSISTTLMGAAVLFGLYIFAT
ncbi:Metallo-dependent phosphatase-like protein [Dipodascopsis uninucleata]